MDVPIDPGVRKQVQICLFYIFCKQQLQGYQCIKEKKNTFWDLIQLHDLDIPFFKLSKNFSHEQFLQRLMENWKCDI